MPLSQLEEQLQLPASTLPAGLAAAEEAVEVEEAWTDVSGGPRALFGESALRLAPKDQPGYAPVWPMRGGRLDVRADQPLSVVRSAVEVRAARAQAKSQSRHRLLC